MDKYLTIIGSVLEDMNIKYIIDDNKAVFKLLRNDMKNVENEETHKIEFIEYKKKEIISISMYDREILGKKKICLGIDADERGCHTQYDIEELGNMKEHLKSYLSSFLKDNDLPKLNYKQLSIFYYLGDE